jgi:hypothetical protein
VICIDHGRNKATTIRQVFYQVLPQAMSGLALFLNAEMIGYVAREKSNHADAFVVVTNMATNVFVRYNIKTPIVS